MTWQFSVQKKKVEEKSKISKSVKDTVAGKPLMSPVSSKARAKGTLSGDVSEVVKTYAPIFLFIST